MEYKIGSCVFDNWKITRKIGRGASGVVYEIQKTESDVVLSSALKVVKFPQDPMAIQNLLDDGMDAASVTKYLQGVVDELIGEIKLMVDMKGFPYVVSCEDYKMIKNTEETQWDVLIRMELLTPLQNYYREKELRESDVYKLALNLAKTLQLFEKKGIIHRDIKPENIFVNQYGDYKLGDFGIARAYDKASVNLSKKGTDNYMAPEVYRGVDYDHTVDIYSLGLVLYKFLNKNRLPFYPLDEAYTNMDTQQALVDRLCGKREMDLPALASEEFGHIILKMCAFHPENRYQNSEELIRDLERMHPADDVVVPKQILEGQVCEEKKVIEEVNVTRSVFADSYKRTTENENKQDEEFLKQEKPSSSTPAEAFVKDLAEKEVLLKQKTSENTYSYENERKERDRTKNSDTKKKTWIKGAAGVAVVLAIAIPKFLSMEYSVTVNGGSGSGEYKSGTSIEITAEDIAGSSFVEWNAEGIKLSAEESSSESIMIRMPRKDVKLTAVYDVDTYTVTVNGGEGSGTFKMNDQVSAKAAEAEVGYTFDYWEINAGNPNIADKNAQNISFSMEEENVELTAMYRALEYELAVEGGNGSGTYGYGEKVSLVAEAPSGYAFSKWSVKEGTIDLEEEELSTSTLTFDMPAENLKIEAEYVQCEFKVTVNNGVGSGTYGIGDTVSISADPLRSGMVFSHWSIDKGTLQLSDLKVQNISFVMPSEELVLTANYMIEKYTLKVNGGRGSGMYSVGDSVTISAEAVNVQGAAFSHWSISGGSLDVSGMDMTQSVLSFSMPNQNIILEANYATKEVVVEKEYNLLVNGGSGSGKYPSGTAIQITHDQPEPGMKFANWIVIKDGYEAVTENSEVLNFNMPECNVVVTAVFEQY